MRMYQDENHPSFDLQYNRNLCDTQSTFQTDKELISLKIFVEGE